MSQSNYWNIDTSSAYYVEYPNPGKTTTRMTLASGLVENDFDPSQATFFDVPLKFIITEGYYSGVAGNWNSKGRLTTPVPMTQERVQDFIKMLNVEYGWWQGVKVRFFLSQHNYDSGIVSIPATDASRILWYYSLGTIAATNTSTNYLALSKAKELIALYGDPRCANIIFNNMFYAGASNPAYALGGEWGVTILAPKNVSYLYIPYYYYYNSGLFDDGYFFHEIGHFMGVPDPIVPNWIGDYNGAYFGAGLGALRKLSNTTSGFTEPGWSGLFTPYVPWLLEHSLNYIKDQTTYRDGFIVKQSTGCNPLYVASGQITITSPTNPVQISWNRVTTNKLGYIIFPNDYQIYSRPNASSEWQLRTTMSAETSPGVFPSGYTYGASTSDLLWKIVPRTTDETWSWKASGLDANWWNYIGYDFDLRYSFWHSTSGIYSFDHR